MFSVRAHSTPGTAVSAVHINSLTCHNYHYPLSTDVEAKAQGS